MNALSILVVEDVPGFRGALEGVLREAGHTVVGAANGREALDLLAERDFDLLITDILLPEVDGLELITKLRMRHPDACVLAMSGGGFLSSDYYLRLAHSVGADAVLVKPFSHEALFRGMFDALAAHPCH